MTVHAKTRVLVSSAVALGFYLFSFSAAVAEEEESNDTKIERAMSAAPGNISAEATIMDVERPHLMLLMPSASMLEGVNRDPFAGGPYVMWGDTPLPRTALGPGRFQASRYLPAMDAAYDPREGTTETTYSAGVPMPDVEGYKYAYRPYQWNQDNQRYEELAYNEFDQSKYPYYPYLPTGGKAPDRNDRILAGVRLVPV